MDGKDQKGFISLPTGQYQRYGMGLGSVSNK